MSAEYVEQLIQKLDSLDLETEDKVKVAEAFACVDEKEVGTLDIDDIGKLLEASGKPLPGNFRLTSGIMSHTTAIFDPDKQPKIHE